MDREMLKDIKGQTVRKRLLAVYKLAGEKIKEQRNGRKSYVHLDVGTYTGFALKEIGSFAEKIISFDMDFHRLTDSAKKNPWIKANEERVSLLNMKAQTMGIADESVDSITCIEVFGAGFEGTEEEANNVFIEMNRVLKPGGTVVFTIKSETMDRILSGVSGFEEEKGYPISHRTIHNLLDKTFAKIDWYGQILGRYIPDENFPGVLIPLRLSTEYGQIYPTYNSKMLEPAFIDMRHSEDNAEKFLRGEATWPRYWVCVAQKN